MLSTMLMRRKMCIRDSYIIALGISGCLITTGNDLSAGRLAGFARCV